MRTQNSEIDVSLFWAKTGSPVRANEWHPVVCHLLDVGAVAYHLLSARGTRFEKETFWPHSANDLCVSEFVTLLVALHDIGKVSAAFQSKAPTLASGLPSQLSSKLQNDGIPHGSVSWRFLRDWLTHSYNLDFRTADDLAKAVAGHHGVVPQNDRFTETNEWNSARQQVAAMVSFSLLKRTSCLSRGIVEYLTPGTILRLAGLTSVADWLGSDTQFFPYSMSMDVRNGSESLTDYFEKRALPAARRATDHVHWNTATSAFDSSVPSFEQLFTDRSTETIRTLMPRSVQVQCKTEAEFQKEPFLLLVEAPTGVGKTEAALWVTEIIRRKIGSSGIYFALPTQATSNQMFQRMERFLARVFPDNVVPLHLLHGLADLNELFMELKRRGSSDNDEVVHLDSIYSDDDNPVSTNGSVIAEEWFCGRKRGLLSPFAVGTVDQALLGVLTVRHHFVRLFGLSRKTVIIDEVHAYDAYMNVLLERLITWLAELGSSVILLSATLPAERRKQLIHAYSGKCDEPESCRYPRVVVATKASIRTSESLVETQKTILFQQTALSTLTLHIAEQLKDGGCCAIICNTVLQAQRLYRQIQRDRLIGSLIPNDDILLFHARFAVKDRLQIEKQVIEKFGKSQERRPKRAVVVATQIIEQSLDLDFDLIISELAPVDLMIQRAGRLHRHERPRPGYLSDPVFEWIPPNVDIKGVPEWGANGFVYDPYILLRTWLLLRKRDKLIVPDDVEDCIEAVYGLDESDYDPAIENALKEAKRKHDAALKKDRALAERYILRHPKHPDGVFSGIELTPDDNDQVAQKLTRLAEPTVTLICAHATEYGIALDPEGVELIADKKPTWSDVQRLLTHSVKVRAATWYARYAIDANQRPKAWQQTALLRDCYLAVFTDNEIKVKEQTLRLDTEFGLVEPTRLE